jgi:ElaB/YqjD/DUF883 family membrane-anchored ribosome-binding protein
MSDKEEVKTHESYGQVLFSRTQGTPVRLYGTTVQSGNTIRLSISHSEQRRHLNRTWYFAHKEIIEVELSQNQFAELITNMNVGTGVPCTIRHLNHKRMENPPFEDVRDKLEKEFQSDINECMDNSLKLIKEADEMLSSSKPITKAKMKELKSVLYKLNQDLRSNLRFVMNSFNEQVQSSVTEAKSEVEAFVENKIRSAGLEHLKEQPQISLSPEMTKEIPMITQSNGEIY